MFGILRFVLAVNVALFHLGDVPTIGPYAVISFFVLSGYLMTAVMRGPYGYSSKGFLRFWTNRFLRLYPFYWFALLLTVLGIWNVTGEEFASNFHAALSVPRNVAEWLQNLSLIFFAERPISVLPRLAPATWALTIELFFYFAISIGFSRSRSVAAIWLAASVAYSLTQTVTTGSGIPYGTLLSASLPFSLGAFLYYLAPSVNRAINGKRTLGIVLASLVYVLNSGIPSFELPIALEPWKIMMVTDYGNLVLSAILVLLLSGVTARSESLRLIDTKFGDLSYPIYVFHWFCACLITYWAAQAGGSVSKSVLLALMSCVLASLSWYLALPIELLSNLVFRSLNQAATWFGSVTSIPSLNFTPVMTFAR